jgi:hypothetical protein
MLNGTENIWERIDKDSWLNYVWCSESKQGWWLTYLVKRDRYPIHTLTNGIFFCSIKILKLGGKHITDRLLSLLSNGKYSFPDDTFLLMRRTGAASSKNRFCVASRRDVVREAKERFCFVADRVSEYRVSSKTISNIVLIQLLSPVILYNINQIWTSGRRRHRRQRRGESSPTSGRQHRRRRRRGDSRAGTAFQAGTCQEEILRTSRTCKLIFKHIHKLIILL